MGLTSGVALASGRACRDIWRNARACAGVMYPCCSRRRSRVNATSNIAWSVQVAATALTVILVGWIWRRYPAAPERFIALAAGTLLSIPLSLIYDLMLLTVAMGWLVRIGRRTGFAPWEKLAMLLCFIVPLISRNLGRDLHVAVAPLAPAALIALYEVWPKLDRPDRPGFLARIGPWVIGTVATSVVASMSNVIASCYMQTCLNDLIII